MTMSETVVETCVIRLRAPVLMGEMARRTSGAARAVLENDDLLAWILSHTDATGFVTAGRVARQWRAVCHRDASLVIAAARTSFLTKRVLVGLLGLSSTEADALPRQTLARRGGGVMHVYPSEVVDRAWLVVGGAEAWRARLVGRAGFQWEIERAFGSKWRSLQWSGARACAVY
jgi:hypothetical protein